MFEKIRNSGFTKQDIIIISFLALTFIAGLVIKFSGWKSAPEYDYTNSDREFEQSVKSAFSNLDSKPPGDEQQTLLKKLNTVKDSLNAGKEQLKLSSKESALNRKINLNNAAIDDLILLPGVGKSIAQRIIEYREVHKGFKKPEEIRNVKGIGEKKYDKLKNLVTIE